MIDLAYLIAGLVLANPLVWIIALLLLKRWKPVDERSRRVRSSAIQLITVALAVTAIVLGFIVILGLLWN